MPAIPFNTPYASAYGFKFDFVDAFNQTATAQGIPINTSFSTIQTSLGDSNDLFPSQQTAWGRANQGMVGLVTLTTPNALGEVGTFNDTPSTNTSLWAYAKQAYIAASGSSVPPGSFTGETIVWDGAAWAITGSALRLGRFAGESTQSLYATALGVEAGRYTQGAIATAIGFEAGESNQGTKAIAIGNQAGQFNQGVNAIAIGTLAGESNQHDNTIILNASGAAINSVQPGAMYINPIRNENANNANWLTYNSMSGEVTFDTALPLSLGASTDAPSLTGSVWAYALQAESDAQFAIGEAATANSWISYESSPNAVNALGVYNDTPSLTTSLWAYAQQTQLDTQTAQTTANRALTYTLTGSTINAQITNRATGSGNAFPQAVFTLATSITYNVPPNWTSTDSVYLDGWVLYNFQGSGNVNSYWGANYTTSQVGAPTTDILGSTSVVANAIHFSVDNQVYLPFNLVIPPTYLVAGGTINISFYAYITSTGHYFSVAPVVAGRVGVALV